MTAPSDPEERAAADLRLLRAAVFTAVCVALSAAGHMIGSCAAVPVWTLGVGCAAVFAVAAPLAGRERSLPGIAVALAVGQLALHSVFALGQHRMAAAPMAAPASGGGLSDQAAIAIARHVTCGLGAGRLDGAEARRILDVSAIGPAGPGTAGHAMDQAAASAPVAHGLLPSLPMLLAHLLAALAAGWLLRRGEAALWRLVRLSAPAAREAAAVAEALVGALRCTLALVRVLCAGLLAAADARPVARFSYGDDQARPKELALQHSVVRRGPPALALAA